VGYSTAPPQSPRPRPARPLDRGNLEPSTCRRAWWCVRLDNGDHSGSRRSCTGRLLGTDARTSGTADLRGRHVRADST